MTASLARANLSAADLTGTDFTDADLRYANLTQAKLCGASICAADLSYSKLDQADFTALSMAESRLGNVDLQSVKGLETVKHYAPSTLGIDTLYRSAGKLPDAFLRGCGVPDDFIPYVSSHFGVEQAIQFYSCFISYSSSDESFTRKLHSRLREAHVRVWFAPEDIKGGQKLYDQIDRAIQTNDRLLLVLSENSMQSEWVTTEIRNARKTEIIEGRRKLFPIRLVDFDTVRAWTCFDADNGKDLAIEIRSYFIPDFTNWEDDNAFETAFARLLSDLRAEEVV
jgi:uncharacterized protein YjbI with pentapeptide repeats